jgi:NADPH:quinone reductase-like Zn-dependent oxidoreductase
MVFMKAAQVTQFGDNDVIQVSDTLPVPQPQADQVQVQVYAASINPFDIKTIRGKTMQMQFPYTPGGDFAGIVSTLGEGIADIKIGDVVFGSANFANRGSGSFAEFAIANVTSLAHKPQTLDFIHAASLPLVGSSAVQALEEHIGLTSGQKILIQGGAGGIGSIAIQLAKYLGAYVATTVSGDDKEFVKSLGADQVIDYKTEKFEDLLKDFDAVFDTVGGETMDRSFLVLKKGGILVSMADKPNEDLANKYEVTAIGQYTQTNTAHLTLVAELVDKGAIKPQVDKIFPLEQVKEAIAYMEKESSKGKVVLRVKE